MDDVEIIGALAYLPQHGERAAKMIGNSRKPETLRRANDEVRFRLRPSTREQGDLVALADEFFRQPANHTLCSTVQLWRYGFGQRSDERDAHLLSFQREHLSSLAMCRPHRYSSPLMASAALVHGHWLTQTFSQADQCQAARMQTGC